MKVVSVLLVVAFLCGLCYGDFIIGQDGISKNFIKMNDDGSNPVALVSAGLVRAGTLALNGPSFYYRVIDTPEDFYLVNTSAPLPNSKKLKTFSDDAANDLRCVVSSGKKLYWIFRNGYLHSAKLNGAKQTLFTAGLQGCEFAAISGKQIIYIYEHRVYSVSVAKKNQAPVTIITPTNIDPLCASKSCKIEDLAIQGKKLWLRVQIDKTSKVVTASLTGTNIQVAFTVPFELDDNDPGLVVLSNNDVVLTSEDQQLLKLTAASGYTTYTSISNINTYKFGSKIISGGGSAVVTPAVPTNLQSGKAFYLSWNPVAGATSYTVFYTLSGTENTLTATTNTNSITINQGVVAGTYSVTVVATIGNTSSAPATSINVVVG